jgi:arylsulfatase A-like enzyme
MTHDQQMFSRRRFVQATAASSLALAGISLGRNGFAQAAKPNIVFILADDLGYADVSCYGQRDYATPNVDRLAIEGLRFTQAYSNSGNCSPTRTGLITGRYQMRLQVGLEEPISPTTPKGIGLPPSHPTLPSLFKKAGYGTSLVGKWHLGFLPDYSPLKSGYDRFFGIFGGAADYFNHGPDTSRSGAAASQLHEQEVPVERHGYMTNLLGDRAVETIEAYARSKEPFLLSLHFTAPHWPWEGPDNEAESKRIRNILHRDGGTQKTYMAMVQSLDSNIGRVLQALDVNGLSANTIVVFTSDNGGERFSKNWPFTGMKAELLEGGLRIPAIARWPGRISAGTVSEQVMISMDWMPTLLAAAELQPDPSAARRQSPSNSHRERVAPFAEAVLALQGWGAARHARRGLEIFTNRRQRIPVRCRQGPTRAGQPQGSQQGRVRSPQERLGSLEQYDVGGAPATSAL